MLNTVFLSVSALCFALAILLGWRFLPRARYQILASLPLRQEQEGWHGVNFTWYGALIATAMVIGILYTLVLSLAAGAHLALILAVLGLGIILCVPAARSIARLVEHKPYTFTIGGAFFFGLLLLPLTIWLVNIGCRFLHLPSLDMAATMAALAIGYLLGEGLGRLACISFGCCYGKPLQQCGKLTTTVLDPIAFIFTSVTKKAVYEGGLAGVKLVPIQGLTSILYCLTALFATALFLAGQYRTAFILSLVVSQLWRVYSETLRADFRGNGSFSAYQIMGLVAVGVALLLCSLLPPSSQIAPDLSRGLQLFTSPLLLLMLQALWFSLFFYFGKSMVTGVQLTYTIHRDRI